jgi:hypothetical protein
VVVVVEVEDPPHPAKTQMNIVRTMAFQIRRFRRRRLKVNPRINASPKEASAMEFTVVRCRPLEPTFEPTLEPIAAPRAINRFALAPLINPPVVQFDPFVSIFSWAVAAAVPEITVFAIV